MGKSSPQQPQPVDPSVTIGAQSQANAETARLQQQLNNVNTVGPTGSVSYSQDPNNSDRWTQTTQLNPQEQQTYDLQKQAQNTALGVANQQAGRVGSALGQNIDFGSLPRLESEAIEYNPLGMPGTDTNLLGRLPNLQTSVGPTDFTADRNAVTDAVFNQAKSRLDPMYGQLQSSLDSKLANQGIGINSQAFGNAQDVLGRNRNDAYNQALYSAVGQGADEQNTLFGQKLQQGNFANTAAQQGFQNFAGAIGQQNQAQQQGFQNQLANSNLTNTARQQSLNEQAYQQNLPINQLSALLGLGQVGAPQGVNYSPVNVGGTDALGAYGLQASQQNSNYQGALSQQNALMGGLAGLGQAAIFASDRRLKRDIERLGVRPDGLGVYLYRYLWSPIQYIGVMAQEVLWAKPEAVVTMPNGFYAVDYGKL